MNGRMTMLAAAERFARRAHAGEATGHDWWHVARVRENAKRIHAEEGGDLLVIELAALLHDVGDRKLIGKDADDYTIADTFLARVRVPSVVRSAVMHVVRDLSFSNSLDGAVKEKTHELCVVQDADRLDALGAIGIARAFAYGGSRGQPLYEPGVAPRTSLTKREYQKNHGGTLNHFEEKLFQLEGLMNTKTGRALARSRTRYMRQYKEAFLDEWEGRA